MSIDCKGTDYDIVPLNKADDLRRMKYDRLEPLYRVMPKNGDHRHVYWLCKCDCGNEVVVDRVNLSRKHARSCGCLCREMANSQIHINVGDIVNGFTFLGRDLTRKSCSGSYFWNVKCPYCGKEYSVDPSTVRLARIKSCGCLNMSKGELEIKRVFESNGISFKGQVTFKDLISTNGGWLKFDFGVYDQNGCLLYLVEYDGVQHYIPKERFGGANEYDTIVKNDNLKNGYCKEHNIPLIRVPYYVKDVSIDMLSPQTSQFLI